MTEDDTRNRVRSIDESRRRRAASDRSTSPGDSSGPPPEASSEGREWVAIARFYEVHRAHMAQAFLASEGIEALMRNAHMAGVAWHYGAAGGGVPLEVRIEDAERALELLASHGELAAEAGSLRSAPLGKACPRCGTPDPDRFVGESRNGSGAARALRSLLRFLGFGPGRRAESREASTSEEPPGPEGPREGLRCRACGFEYQE